MGWVNVHRQGAEATNFAAPVDAPVLPCEDVTTAIPRHEGFREKRLRAWELAWIDLGGEG